MARIRTIKPEFPQSESMGRVSRAARYCFIMLWTIADDAGRLRGASRMLASLLYPYDDDASSLIDDWLAELEAENCIARYTVDRTQYIQIVKWLEHQKIDKPSQSKIPEFAEASRKVSRAPEDSATDLVPVPRTKDQDHCAADARVPSLAQQVCQIAGADCRTHANWHMVEPAVARWLGSGHTEVDILTGVRAAAAKRTATGQGPPNSPKFFDGPVADARAARLAPMPEGQPHAQPRTKRTDPRFNADRRRAASVAAVMGGDMDAGPDPAGYG